MRFIKIALWGLLSLFSLSLLGEFLGSIRPEDNAGALTGSLFGILLALGLLFVSIKAIYNTWTKDRW